MATILLPRCTAGKRVFQKSLQHSESYLRFRCPIHTGYTLAARTVEVASSNVNDRIKSYIEIPGPKPLPIIGNTWRFIPGIGEYYERDIQKFYIKMYNKFGPICSVRGLLGRKDMVLIYRPEDVETTFRNEGPRPIREGFESITYYRTKKEFYNEGSGILFDQGKKWFEARSIVNQSMMQPKISKYYIKPIADVAEDFVQKMRSLKDDKDEMPADFMNEIFKWSLESITNIALDTRLGCLESNLKRDSDSQKMINAVGETLECLFYLESRLPLWRMFPTPMWKKYTKAFDLFLEVSVKYMEEAIQRANKRKAEGKICTEPSLLERLLEKGDPKSACILVQDMLFAGVDTTSYSVAMAMYQLSTNPGKQEMLFKELKRVLPSKSDSITEEKIGEMKYLKACLKESARTRPILTVILRTTVKDIVLSNYKVPKGVWIVMPSAISRLSDEYFPLSDRYIPERWLKNRPTDVTAGCPNDFDVVSKGKRQPFASLPFGFGARSCIGKRYADLEMEILFAKIIRNFRIEYHYEEMAFKSGILITPKDPLRFKVIERKE